MQMQVFVIKKRTKDPKLYFYISQVSVNKVINFLDNRNCVFVLADGAHR